MQAGPDKKELVLRLRGDVGQRRRKAASREAGCRVTRSEFLGRSSIGRDKPAIGFIELTTDLAAGGMDEGGGRFLRSLWPIVRMLAENGGNAERLVPGSNALRSKLAFDLSHKCGGTLAPCSFGEAFPAGERREGQCLASRISQPVEGLSPPPGRVLSGAIEPIALDRPTFGEVFGSVETGPIARPLNQSFLRAVAEDVLQSLPLCALLRAHQDRLISPGPELVPPICESANFSSQVGVDVAHELGELPCRIHVE